MPSECLHSLAIANTVATRISDLGFTAVHSSKILRADLAGGPRQTMVVRLSRLNKVSKRATELRALSAPGVRTLRCFAVEPTPLATWAVAISGFSDTHQKKLHTTASTTTSSQTRNKTFEWD